MNTRERVRCAHGNMYAYASRKREIEDFVDRATNQCGRQFDRVGTRGSSISDPSGRGGIMLADPPPRIKSALDWCCAIEDAWAECRMLDDGNDRGVAYLLETYFCLDGKERSRDKNRESSEAICAECGISKSTFYAWLGRVTEIVCYHAARRGLV